MPARIPSGIDRGTVQVAPRSVECWTAQAGAEPNIAALPSRPTHTTFQLQPPVASACSSNTAAVQVRPPSTDRSSHGHRPIPIRLRPPTRTRPDPSPPSNVGSL
jgi:hypothetical protein